MELYINYCKVKNNRTKGEKGSMETANGQNPEFLTTGRLAKRLGILPATVNIWARTGRIPHYNISNHYYYKWTEVEEWLLSRRGLKAPARKK